MRLVPFRVSEMEALFDISPSTPGWIETEPDQQQIEVARDLADSTHLSCRLEISEVC